MFRVDALEEMGRDIFDYKGVAYNLEGPRGTVEQYLLVLEVGMEG